MSTQNRFQAFDDFFGFDNSAETLDNGGDIYLQDDQLEKLEAVLKITPQLEQLATKQAEVDRLKIETEHYKRVCGSYGMKSEETGLPKILKVSGTPAGSNTPSYLDGNNPFNQMADRRCGSKN